MSNKAKPTKEIKPIIAIDKYLHHQVKMAAASHLVTMSSLVEGMIVEGLQRISTGKTTALKLSEKAPSKSKS